MPVGRLAIGWLISAVLVLSGACGSQSGKEEDRTTGSATNLLGFTGTTLDGKRFEGRSLAGKPSVLWFWAPWCPTCRAQSPGVTRLAATHRGRVNVISVGGLDKAADIREFAKHVPGITHLTDEQGAVWRHFGITEQSTYVVLDANGTVVSKGYLDDAKLAEKVAGLAAS